jgi:CheY-like chemotaxis protein
VGLGLPICASLLKKMGSELKLDSTPGAGSRFYFTIRAECEEKAEGAQLAADATAADRKGAPSPLKPVRPVTVLIAEDQKVNRRLMKFLVSKLLPGARVLEAVDGLEAVRLFREENPDIVFMDLHMPRLEGIAAAAEIRALERGGRRTPIIAVTADVQPETRRSCLEGGMDGYLGKPLDVWNLRDLLARHLEGLLEE